MTPSEAAIQHELQTYSDICPGRRDVAIRRIRDRENISARPFLCGTCGARFASKGNKRQHKLTCRPIPSVAEAENDDESLYGRFKNGPEIKARAHAEWAAMDEYGQLPGNWEARS